MIIRIRERFKYLLFALYPATSLKICITCEIIASISFAVISKNLDSYSKSYDMLFALFTGITASIIVAVIIELISNYKTNRRGMYELADYYGAVSDARFERLIDLKLTHAQIIEKKAIEDFVRDGGEYIPDEHETALDAIQSTWKRIHEFIPVFEDTYNNKKEFLLSEEIESLDIIISAYNLIKNRVRMIVEKDYMYDSLNHPDISFINLLFPQNVIDDMPDLVKDKLTFIESEKAVDYIVSVIMKESSLLDYYMEKYEVSLETINSYNLDDDSDDELNDKYEMCDDSSKEDEMTEAEYRESRRQIDIELEEANRPFTSWFISRQCQIIDNEMGILEKHLKRKPYVGLILEVNGKNKRNVSPNDEISKTIYNHKLEELQGRMNDEE